MVNYTRHVYKYPISGTPVLSAPSAGVMSEGMLRFYRATAGTV
jgi:hypothetical protein